MKTTEWPNKLGFDVNEHEVWKLSNGNLGVRTFNNDIPDKYMEIDPLSELFPITPKDAVLICLTKGTNIE